MNDEKKGKLELFLKGHGMKLTESFTAFMMEKVPKSNFVLLEDTMITYSARPPNKNSHKYEDSVKTLCTLRSFLTSFADAVPVDNFLNTFGNFDSVGDENAKTLAEAFIHSPSDFKGLWLYGPSGVGKSHLLHSMFYSYHQKFIESQFTKLSKNSYSQCRDYGGSVEQVGRPTIEHPELVFANYMGNRRRTSSHNHGPGYGVPDFNSEDKIIFFLDDVCDVDSEKIMSSLLRIYESRTGRFVMTSNYSLSEWINRENRRRSSAGLEGRFKTFIKEVEVGGSSRRRPSW